MQLIYEQLVKVGISIILGGCIGWEREKLHKPAGLRTHTLVCLGSALLSMISIDYFVQDTARIISSIVSGVGFLGAGAIIAQGHKGVHGLTTAASLWIASAVGICIGIGWYLLATISTVLILLILIMGKYEHNIKNGTE